MGVFVCLIAFSLVGAVYDQFPFPWTANLPSLGGSHPGRPTPGREEGRRPLGTPAPVSVASDAYRLLDTADNGGKPVAYDPCRPIHFVVRSQGEPVGGQQILEAAIARVSVATGLKFVDDGATSEAPSSQREAYQPRTYGDRWAPVLVAWETPEENPDFAAGVVGEAGSVPIRLQGSPTAYVTGQVQLDAPRITSMLMNPREAPLVRGIVEHELGHLVGLGHVTDRGELMYPEAGVTRTDFGPGDLTGLAKLGGGACAPRL